MIPIVCQTEDLYHQISGFFAMNWRRRSILLKKRTVLQNQSKTENVLIHFLDSDPFFGFWSISFFILIHFFFYFDPLVDFVPFFEFRSILWLCSIFGFWSIFAILTFETFDNKSLVFFLFSRFITLWWHLWNINMKNISSFSLLDT